MKVLLLAMPDAISALDGLVTIPNIGLVSIAGNLTDCDVRVLDLVGCRRDVRGALLAQLRNFGPDVVGLSAMTFQYDSAVKVARIVREWNPEAHIVLGGYHASLLYEEVGVSPEANLFDFLVRGEGELTFDRLIQALRKGSQDFSGIPGLSIRVNGEFNHNPPGPLADLESLKAPNRSARVHTDFTYFGFPFDCVETSRGCTMSCRFCSIREMYGRRFRKFPLQKVITEVDEIRRAGGTGVFFVDDNITLDTRWLQTLCEAIVTEGLNDLQYVIQASVDGIYADLSLPGLLAKAGFRVVFLGIESGSQHNLDIMNKGYSATKTKEVVSALHAQGIVTLGGFIVGNPDDRPENIRDVFRFAREIGVDHAIVQCLTPYPKTEIREQLAQAGLISNPEGFASYNGFIANVKTRHMSSLQLARETVKAGIPYYMNPSRMNTSLMWKYSKSAVWTLLLNNLKFIYSGWRNRMFASTHKF
jgi:anaerobic magnesium-protoporphyrin IX monomethyl ester cyclase